MQAFLQNFVNNGGVAIVLGSWKNGCVNNIFNTGLLQGNNYGISNSNYCTTVSTSNQLCKNLNYSIQSPTNTCILNITNSGKTKLVTYNGYDMFVLIPQGKGYVIYFGYDFYYKNATIGQQITDNIFNWIQSNRKYLTLPSNITIQPNGYDTIPFVFTNDKLVGGNYKGNIVINSSDSITPKKYLEYQIFVDSTPCVKFGMQISACNSLVKFKDSSTNGAVSWNWDFGDGQSAITQNPYHNYSSTGSYQVSFAGCSINGLCDTVKKTVVIQSQSGPAGTTCRDTTTTPAATYGILHLLFNTINKISSNALEGNKDFSCTDSTVVNDSSHYLITIQQPGTIYQGYSVWIDYNNNGIYEAATETPQTYYSTQNFVSFNVFINAPNIVYNKPVRMRVYADYFAISNPGYNLAYGQFEDYALIINRKPLKPIPKFNSTNIFKCDSVVYSFRDTSLYHPTSWLWKFGDGSVSTVQHPMHVYHSNGTYIQKLFTTNSFGTDSVSKTIVINSVFNKPVMSHSGNLTAGSNIQFNVTYTGQFNSMDCDFGDGGGLIFLLTNSPKHVYNTAGTFPIHFVYYSANGCTYDLYDTVVVNPNTSKPAVNFSIDPAIATCAFGIYGFYDSTLHIPTSWKWSFGDGTIAISQNPYHQYKKNGTYTVKLIATNSFGVDSLSKPLTINNIISVNIISSGSYYTNQPIQFTTTFINGSATITLGILAISI